MDVSVKIDQAAAALRGRWNCAPRVGIVLGTGRGGFSSLVDSQVTVDYDEVPHLNRSSALGHKGRFVCGQIEGLPVVTMDGRLHRYEGHPWWQITFPIRVMRALGIRLLILSNASGGLNPECRTGDIMIIEDHIDLMGAKTAMGECRQPCDPCHGASNQPYDATLIERGLEVARRKNIRARRGVYAALRGPNYETRAEYRFLRQIGADVVGMSTVPEVMVAAQLGLRVFALSVVTNVCRPDTPNPTDGATVVAAAAKAEPRVRDIVLGVLDYEKRPAHETRPGVDMPWPD